LKGTRLLSLKLRDKLREKLREKLRLCEDAAEKLLRLESKLRLESVLVDLRLDGEEQYDRFSLITLPMVPRSRKAARVEPMACMCSRSASRSRSDLGDSERPLMGAPEGYRHARGSNARLSLAEELSVSSAASKPRWPRHPEAGGRTSLRIVR
jgi:hypothetical protein